LAFICTTEVHDYSRNDPIRIITTSFLFAAT